MKDVVIKRGGMRTSKYWDDFNRRIDETVKVIQNNQKIKIRRVACFITNKCNFRCKYCNHSADSVSMNKNTFIKILKLYGNTAIIHITGGEPSVIPWLYPFIIKNGNKFRFHLNTNAYIKPPSKSIKRLKVSLDSCHENYWNELVGRNAFKRVILNIKEASKNTVTSITYTLTKQNYKNAVEFAEFCNKEFPNLYALFFSVYKGDDKRFVFDTEDVNYFFLNVLPKLLKILPEESKNLICETIDEKIRLMKGVRFKQNCTGGICYLSMSEKIFSPEGNEYTCSHLYRDGIYMSEPNKHDKCKYGCNRRLVAFNEEVSRRIK